MRMSIDIKRRSSIVLILLTIAMIVLFILRLYGIGKYEITTQRGTYYSNEAPIISGNCVTFTDVTSHKQVTIHGTYTITTLK